MSSSYSANDAGPRPVLLLGADSRAAVAIRTALGDRPIVSVGRRAGAAIHVDRYENVPAGAIPPRAVVVNCVGTAGGKPDALRRINCDVPVRWAEAACEAGASHFIQLSSFSIYGRAEDVSARIPEAPVTSYGCSKLAADRALQQLQTPSVTVTILRTPILVEGGGGGDKLAQLIRLALRTGSVPAVRPPVERSMLSYGALGVAVRRLIDEPVAGVVLAADPHFFTYELLREQLETVTGRQFRAIPIPRFLTGPMRLAVPGLHSRLLASSRLDPSANFLKELPPETGLAATLARMIREAKAD